MVELKIDPEFKNLIPALSEEELQDLEISLLNEGCRDALVVWNNTIVDGHNRYELCKKHNIKFDIVEREFDTRDLVKAWIIRNQFARRNLTPYVRATLALKLKDIVAAQAKENQGKRTDILTNLTKSDPIHTRKEISKTANVSEGTMHKVETIETKAPESIREKARKGELSTHRAYQLTQKLENASDVVRRVVSETGIEEPKIVDLLIEQSIEDTDFENDLISGKITINDDVIEVQHKLKQRKTKKQRLDRQQIRRELAQDLPNKVYNVVYADPAWQYDNTGIHGAAEKHYGTTSLNEICDWLDNSNLQINCNAVLFLWVTNPFVRDAFKVIDAWDFVYKTNLVWVKTQLVKPGSGFYVRGRHELLYVCTRGSFLPLEDVSPPIGSVVEAPIQEHSRKPDVFYDIIERLYPECNYIELFGRHKRSGWDILGDEL